MDESKATVANGSDPKVVAEPVLKIAKTENQIGDIVQELMLRDCLKLKDR